MSTASTQTPDNFLTMEETWRDIVDFEQLYQVSNFGRVRSVDRTILTQRGPFRYKGKILSPSIGTNGYYGLVLRKNGCAYPKMIHRLVAEAFIGIPPNMEVDHIDFNKLNNHISNLQILSHISNVRRSSWYNSGYNKSGEHNPRAKSIVRIANGKQILVSNCGKEFCKGLGMNYSTFRAKMQKGGIIINNITYKYGTAYQENCKKERLHNW